MQSVQATRLSLALTLVGQTLLFASPFPLLSIRLSGAAETVVSLHLDVHTFCKVLVFGIGSNLKCYCARYLFEPWVVFRNVCTEVSLTVVGYPITRKDVSM